MRIRYNEEDGFIEIDGAKISASVLRGIADPDKRLLFRFVMRSDGIISAVPYTEQQIIWIDRVEESEDGKIEFGVSNQEEQQ